MRELQMSEQHSISGGLVGAPVGTGDVMLLASDNVGTTQTFDDGSMLITGSGGQLVGAIGTDGSFYQAQNWGTPQIPAWVSGLLPTVPSLLAEVWNGIGQYNSAAGSGPRGTQNLPESPPVLGP
jgi:hypothetical protein